MTQTTQLIRLVEATEINQSSIVSELIRSERSNKWIRIHETG
jgi:hypothetical protein